ncbi:hypothetical protein M405DRAFT_581114 [Rhizopogon salebrosus TDB-379]|nr:hypothetical protein M405DRAFT_581114 [Rhizopogon salebrosus TDB-379]
MLLHGGTSPALCILVCWIAIDYLTIPATSVNAGHLFSHGQLLLSCSFAFVLTVNMRIAVLWCLELFEPCQGRRCIESHYLARC